MICHPKGLFVFQSFIRRHWVGWLFNPFGRGVVMRGILDEKQSALRARVSIPLDGAW